MKKSTKSFLYFIPLFAIAVLLSSCDSSVTNSEDLVSGNVEFEQATEAVAYFDVQPDNYSSAGGTVTVEYLGEEVSINYQANWDQLDVGASLAQAINNDSNIELYATVYYYYYPNRYARIRVRERRSGTQYYGNPVYLSDNNSTNHIKLSDSVVYLFEEEV